MPEPALLRYDGQAYLCHARIQTYCRTIWKLSACARTAGTRSRTQSEPRVASSLSAPSAVRYGLLGQRGRPPRGCACLTMRSVTSMSPRARELGHLPPSDLRRSQRAYLGDGLPSLLDRGHVVRLVPASSSISVRSRLRAAGVPRTIVVYERGRSVPGTMRSRRSHIGPLPNRPAPARVARSRTDRAGRSGRRRCKWRRPRPPRRGSGASGPRPPAALCPARGAGPRFRPASRWPPPLRRPMRSNATQGSGRCTGPGPAREEGAVGDQAPCSAQNARLLADVAIISCSRAGDPFLGGIRHPG